MARTMDGDEGVRAAGATLVASGLLLVLLMAHHPTGADPTALVRGVHGAILLVMLAMTIGFALFVRAAPTPLTVAGFVPLAAGMAAGAGAGTINGFVVPRLVDQGVTGFGPLLWAANQSLAELGVIATGIAYALWSLALWRRGWRATAAGGAVAGIGPAALLLGGAMAMDLHGALVAYGANALWAAWLGAVLWRAGRTA